MLQLRVRIFSQHPTWYFARGANAFEHHPVTYGWVHWLLFVTPCLSRVEDAADARYEHLQRRNTRDDPVARETFRDYRVPSAHESFSRGTPGDAKCVHVVAKYPHWCHKTRRYGTFDRGSSQIGLGVSDMNLQKAYDCKSCCA